MTVSSTITKNSYNGDGSTVAFSYTFKILDDDDIAVYLRDDATSTETLQVKTTNYTVSGVGDTSGGTITFVTAPASGKSVVLLRSTPLTQVTDYVPNDPFPAEAHEDALDKLTFITQEIKEELGRSLKVSQTNEIATADFTAGPAARANKVLGFDAAGDLVATQELGVYRGTDATITTADYVVRDLVKSTTAGQLDNVYIALQNSPTGTLLTNTTYWALIVDAVSAAASAAAAAVSESNAATSEANAATSESNAATSASNAATSESNASSSASSASTSASNASAAQAAAEAALDAFTDQYLGALSSDPSTDLDGDALTDGDLYFNTTDNVMKVYDLGTTTWKQLTPTSAQQANIDTVATDIANVNTVATNLTDVNAFAETYFISATAPASPTEGDLWFDTTNDIMKVYDGSGWINAGSSVNGTANRYVYTATSGQTSFAATYDAGFIDVYLNGVKLQNGTDFTATDGANVVLTTGAALNDLIDIVAYGTFSLLSTTLDDISDVSAAGATSGQVLSYNGTNWVPVAAASGDVVDDTTPQLGGNLDTNGNNINFGDNDKAIFGAGSGDLEIYSDGTYSRIMETGGLFLVLDTNGSKVSITSDNSKEMGNFVKDGAVELYHNNSKKIETTATGCAITGGLTTTGNVGIGTSSPQRIIHTKSSVPAIRLEDSDVSGLYHEIVGTATGEVQFKIDAGNVQSGSDLAFLMDGSERMRIDSSGNLLVGTTSSSGNKFKVERTDNDNAIAEFKTNNANGDVIIRSSGGYGRLRATGTNELAFLNAGTEAMRIDSSGYLYVGTTTAYGNGGLSILPNLTNGACRISFDRASTTVYSSVVLFRNGGTQVGGISYNSTSTAYNTSSDYRLKENVTADWDATTRLKQLNPVRFNFITDADTTVDGFLAHEVQDIVPEAITGTKDAMRDEEYEVTPAVFDEDGNEVTPAVMGTRSVPEYQGIDQSKLVPLLVKTIQELEARITALENV